MLLGSMDSEGLLSILVLAGPSSSGKTTLPTSCRRRLNGSVYLLDSFAGRLYLGCQFYPKLPTGDPVWSRCKALDLPL